MSTSNTLVIIKAANCVKSNIVRYMAKVKGVEFVVLDSASPAATKLAKTLGISEFPAIIERALIVSDFDLILEFVEERYPEPSLFPAEPTSRAMFRTTMRRLHAETFALLAPAVAGCAASRERLEADLAALDQMVYGSKFFGSNAFSCMDVNLVPFLYAVEKAGLLADKLRSLRTYASTHIESADFKAMFPSSEESLAA
ncbi:glutathione S-transferase family protein [Pseudomonas sp. NPDC089569]|uniref:glutathione S-transferase family protein n=1 Tax=Pseudomonas sp. NPDC089569 TaxID=3390722 RepID=UPI003D059E26